MKVRERVNYACFAPGTPVPCTDTPCEVRYITRKLTSYSDTHCPLENRPGKKTSCAAAMRGVYVLRCLADLPWRTLSRSSQTILG